MSAPHTCAHCGAPDVGADLPGGWGQVDGQPLCHPDSDDRLDCYHYVTVHHEEIGSRMGEGEEPPMWVKLKFATSPEVVAELLEASKAGLLPRRIVRRRR